MLRVSTWSLTHSTPTPSSCGLIKGAMADDSGNSLVWQSHTHKRAARGSGCKPIIGFVILAVGFLQHQSDCRTDNYQIPTTSRIVYLYGDYTRPARSG